MTLLCGNDSSSNLRDGNGELGQYVGGAAAARAGAISGGEMTVEAAVAKMMIGLGRFGAGGDLAQYLATSIVGER